MKELEEELKKVLHEYYPLHMLNPKNELLKYFVLNENEFRQNNDEEIKLEFIRKFMGDYPTLDFLIEKGMNMSVLEYGQGLLHFLFLKITVRL
jgi:hypothetical protein